MTATVTFDKAPSPIAAECPTCFAKPLEHCITMGGRSCKPHAARRAAVQFTNHAQGTITTGTGPEPAPVPPWGIAPPEEVKARAAWGARAIYKNAGSVSLLWDRQGGKGHNASLMELLTWLDKVALPELRRDCRLPTWSEDTFEINAGRFFLRATPKRSGGYLYIGAWVIQGDDTTST